MEFLSVRMHESERQSNFVNNYLQTIISAWSGGMRNSFEHGTKVIPAKRVSPINRASSPSYKQPLKIDFFLGFKCKSLDAFKARQNDSINAIYFLWPLNKAIELSVIRFITQNF